MADMERTDKGAGRELDEDRMQAYGIDGNDPDAYKQLRRRIKCEGMKVLAADIGFIIMRSIIPAAFLVSALSPNLMVRMVSSIVGLVFYFVALNGEER